MKKLNPDDFRTADMYDKYVAANLDAIFKPTSNDALLNAVQDAISTGTGMYEVKHISPSGFIKLDTGKRRLSLIEPQFIDSLGDVITFGAEKYAPNNWRLCEDTSRYKDALLRHIYAYLSGEQSDPETELPHLAHAACNLMFLQYFDNLKKDQS
jgi:hypothetical protein